MTTHAPAVAYAAAAVNAQERDAADEAAFDAVEFSVLSEMIGEDGVREMVDIFAAETRQRVQRLAAGIQPCAALVREMHTLKGAASTVAAPCLAAMGLAFERAAKQGIEPTAADLRAIGTALEAFLAAVRTWHETAGISSG